MWDSEQCVCEFVYISYLEKSGQGKQSASERGVELEGFNIS